MDERLEIHTLGGLSVQRNGTPIADFDQRKVPAILVYLAMTARTHARELLAELFWEDRSQSASLANLRVALSDLRKTVGPFVDITRETVGMNGDGEVWLDAFAFEEHLGQAGTYPARLEHALELYQGDFLEGFFVDSQGFEDWARLERERLRLRAMEALDRLIDGHLMQGDYASGIRQATRLLQLDPLREKTHRQLMRLLALSGEREAALAQYETCRVMLATEFGVQPTAATDTLFEQIRTGQLAVEADVTVTAEGLEPSTPAPAWRPRHNIPVQPTSFVGREREITAISDQLANPECRLLTLVGPGGIGKTRLALAVAKCLLEEFNHGVFFVPLAALDRTGSIAPAIAAATGFQASRRERDLEQELLNFLSNKQMLLVLDNFEHLLAGAEVVSRILSAAPAVTVLATSRQPLDLGWEWLFEVRGLAHPTTPGDGREDFSALRLFAERARRAKPDFRLAPVRESVVRICQLVDGMPLGIEIAATWVRGLPCATIADELLALETPRQDVPERHRSLRALCDYTWQRLSPTEQRILRGLSVFRGGFTAEAAEAVTGASFIHLVTLLNKSLLAWDSENGRYNVHELVRQYAAEQLRTEPAEEQVVRVRHSEYYLTFLADRFADIRDGLRRDILDDLDNVLAAWGCAASDANLSLVGASMQSLFWFFFLQLGLDPLASPAFVEARNALAQKLRDGPERDAIIGQLLAMESHLTLEVETKRALADESLALVNVSGDPSAQALAEVLTAYAFAGQEKEHHLRRAVELYCDLGDEWSTAFSTMALGWSLFIDQMRPTEALAETERALKTFRELRSPQGIVSVLIGVGNLAGSQGDFKRARSCWQEAFETADQFEPPNWRTKGLCLNNTAWNIAQYGSYSTEAEEQAQQAITISKEYGTPFEVSSALNTLALVKYIKGDYAAAARLTKECVEIAQSPGYRVGPDTAGDYEFMALIAQATCNIRAAYLHLARSMALGLEHRLPSEIINTMQVVALTFARDGRKARALDLLGFTIPRPVFNKLPFLENDLRVELEAAFGAEALEAAIERGRELDPFELAREVLAELEQLV